MPRPPLTITPIRTSCVLLQIGDFAILTDPFFADRMSGRKVIRQPALSVAQLPPIQLLLASHLHADHFDPPVVAQLIARNPHIRLVGTAGTSRFCRKRGLLGTQISAAPLDMRPGDELMVDEVAITALPCRHTGPPPPEVNYLLAWRGWQIFFGGDARLSDRTEEAAAMIAARGTLDLALLPVGGSEIWLRRTTMGPDDAVRACALLKPQLAMGIHEGGEWPAMPPMSRHPGRRADFERLLAASDLTTATVSIGPGEVAVIEDRTPISWRVLSPPS